MERTGKHGSLKFKVHSTVPATGLISFVILSFTSKEGLKSDLEIRIS